MQTLRPLLVNIKEASQMIGVRNNKFDQIRKMPGFPKPKFPNGKRPMYVTSELQEWVKSLE